MAITTKPPASAAIPNAKTTVAESAAGIPVTKTTVAESTAAIPVSKTTVAENAAAIPVSKTTIAESSPSIPVSKTTVAAAAAAIPVSKTTVPAAGVPRTLIPLVDMHFDSETFSQNGNAVLFGDLFTYARSSSATFINRRIVNNKAEFFLDTDFVGTVTNLILFSEQIDNAAWTKTRSSINPNVTASPLGDISADKLIEDSTAANSHYTNQSVTASASVSSSFSVYLKADTRTQARLLNETLSQVEATFDLIAGVVINQGVNAVASITPDENGFFRCSITYDTGAGGAQNHRINLVKDGSVTYNGDGVSGLFIWGAQLTESVKVQPYVKTIASSAMQTFTESLRIEFDAATGENFGALTEEASTNVILRSEELDNASWGKLELTVTANAVKAPDNTRSADTLTPSTNASSHQVSQAPTLTANTKVTISICGRANGYSFIRIAPTDKAGGTVNSYFNVSTGQLGTIGSGHTNKITDVGNGFFRCELTYDTLSGATATTIRIAVSENDNISSFAGDGVSGVHAWGVQVEEIPVATSYIRTEGSPVSRVDDDLTFSTVGNEPTALQDATYHIKANVPNLPTGGTGTKRTIFNAAQGGASAIRVIETGELEFLHGGNTPDIAADGAFGPSFTASGSFKGSTNSSDLYLNGVFVANFGAGTIYNGGIADMGVGSTAAPIEHLNGHIKKFTIYGEALTAQEVGLL